MLMFIWSHLGVQMKCQIGSAAQNIFLSFSHSKHLSLSKYISQWKYISQTKIYFSDKIHFSGAGREAQQYTIPWQRAHWKVRPKIELIQLTSIFGNIYYHEYMYIVDSTPNSQNCFFASCCFHWLWKINTASCK